MPLLFLIVVFIIHALYKRNIELTPKAGPKDKVTLDRIGKEITGKSQNICKQILKKYR